MGWHSAILRKELNGFIITHLKLCWGEKILFIVSVDSLDLALKNRS